MWQPSILDMGRLPADTVYTRLGLRLTLHRIAVSGGTPAVRKTRRAFGTEIQLETWEGNCRCYGSCSASSLTIHFTSFEWGFEIRANSFPWFSTTSPEVIILRVGAYYYIRIRDYAQTLGLWRERGGLHPGKKNLRAYVSWVRESGATKL
jgi:hypothetical protein